MSDVETQARELGWVDKDSFKGDPDKWIDADTFVKRGQEIMPLLKANNKRLQEKVDKLSAENQRTQQLLIAATESIEALKETTSKAAIADLKKNRKEMVERVKEAREDGDVETEIQLQKAIQEADDAIEQSAKPAKEKKATESETDPAQNPEFRGWAEDNPWFGQDRRKTALALAIAGEMRANGDKTEGRKFFDKVTEELNKTLGIDPDASRKAPSKVEGESRSAASGGKRGKSYADLPADAKQVCDRQAAKLVGPGRAFKNEDAWRVHYATKYFEGEE